MFISLLIHALFFSSLSLKNLNFLKKDENKDVYISLYKPPKVSFKEKSLETAKNKGKKPKPKKSLKTNKPTKPILNKKPIKEEHKEKPKTLPQASEETAITQKPIKKKEESKKEMKHSKALPEKNEEKLTKEHHEEISPKSKVFKEESFSDSQITSSANPQEFLSYMEKVFKEIRDNSKGKGIIFVKLYQDGHMEIKVIKGNVSIKKSFTPDPFPPDIMLNKVEFLMSIP